MTASLAAAVAAAGVLGVTHAVEPDHVAGISALTSRYGDSRRSMLAGACFALGHVGLVAVWVLVSYLFLGRSSYPPVFDAVGTVGVGVLLGLLGAAMVVGGIRRVVHVHAHEHGDVVHRHPHLHGPWTRAGDHEHDHDAASFLKTGLVGALFTLSPPLSMIAFASTLFPSYGPGVVALAVAVYAIAIVGTMGLLGAGVGVLSGQVGEASGRAYAVFEVAAGFVLGALAVGFLGGGLGFPF